MHVYHVLSWTETQLKDSYRLTLFTCLLHQQEPEGHTYTLPLTSFIKHWNTQQNVSSNTWDISQQKIWLIPSCTVSCILKAILMAGVNYEGEVNGTLLQWLQQTLLYTKHPDCLCLEVTTIYQPLRTHNSHYFDLYVESWIRSHIQIKHTDPIASLWLGWDCTVTFTIPCSQRIKPALVLLCFGSICMAELQYWSSNTYGELQSGFLHQPYSTLAVC